MSNPSPTIDDSQTLAETPRTPTLSGTPKFLNRATISILFAFAITFFFRHFQPIPGISPSGQAVFGVFLWFIICMITNCIPRAIVGLTSPLLLVLLAGMPIPQAFHAFNTNIFFLAAGAFVIAAVMMGTPLGKRIALAAATLMHSSRADRVLLGLSLAELATHPVVPVVNETALFLPICKGVESVMEGQEHRDETRRINTAVYYLIAGMLPLFIGPLILTSHFPNLILVAYLHTNMHIDISWGRWLWLNLPLWGLLPILFLYVVWYFRLRNVTMPGAEVGIAELRKELGPITWPEIWTIICLGIAMLLWIFGPIKSGMTALLAAFLLMLPWGGLNFEKINKHMLWDVLMLLGGAISLGTALYHSGIVQWASNLIATPIKHADLPIWVVMPLLVFAFHIPRAGIVSAVAAATAFVPLVVGLATALHYNVLPFSLVVGNCLSYAFFLPISITAFLIAWSASKTTAWEAMKFGIPMSIIANVYVLLVQPAWLRLIGLPM